METGKFIFVIFSTKSGTHGWNERPSLAFSGEWLQGMDQTYTHKRGLDDEALRLAIEVRKFMNVACCSERIKSTHSGAFFLSFKMAAFQKATRLESVNEGCDASTPSSYQNYRVAKSV